MSDPTSRAGRGETQPGVVATGREGPPERRSAPAQMAPSEFRRIGYGLVDRIASMFERLPSRPATARRTAAQVAELLHPDALPETGTDALRVLERACDLLGEHSASTSHPRFWAYIMGAANPLGALADLLASAVNPPVTSFATGPLAVAIEAQTVRWLADLVGYPSGGSGVLLSGGSVANFAAIRTALQARAGWDVREMGITGERGAKLRLYVSGEAHASVISGARACGLGAVAVRSVAVDSLGRMKAAELERCLDEDVKSGGKPFMVVATAGTTATGAIDPLSRLAEICEERGCWFHVDGSYGGFATMSSEAPPELGAMARGDSLTIDPHKWLYIPADVGCLLTRHRAALRDAFRQEAHYYGENDEQRALGGPEVLQFRDLGPETTRRFRALKVWVCLQAFGREGYARMIDDDIRLARRLFEVVTAERELEARTHHLSIVTFRYVPTDLSAQEPAHFDHLNKLNRAILAAMQSSGTAFPSHVVLDGDVLLRVCIVNCNTVLDDIEALPRQIIALGRTIDATLRP